MAQAPTGNAHLQELLTTVDRKNLFKVDAGGKMVPVDVKDLEGKVVGLYFSASWCPPCKRFTPVLAEAYKHLQKDGKPFEVVFVSLDNDPNAYANYLRAMPWLAVPYGCPSLGTIQSEYSVMSIPKLVILDENGQMLNSNAVSDVIEKGVDGFPWKNQRKSVCGNCIIQ